MNAEEFEALVVEELDRLPDDMVDGLDNVIFVVEDRRRQEVRPAVQGSRQRFTFPPSPNLGMITRQQHVRHSQSLAVGRRQFGRPGVVRKIKQAAAERILGHRLLITDHTRH